MNQASQEVGLWDAAKEGDIPTMRDLLKAGVNLNALDNRGDYKNRTALMHAAAHGRLEAVDFLIKAGARVDLKDKGSGDLAGGNTALLLAVKHEQPEVAQRLLDAGASPHVKSRGITVMGQAAFFGYVTLVSKLLSLGADPNKKTSKIDDVPLEDAILGGHEDVAEILLKAGADPNLRGPGGNSTPLSSAAIKGLAKVAKLLLDGGADPNAACSQGFTALLMAVTCGQKQVAEILVERGASVNERNVRGETALDIVNDNLDREFDDFFISQLEREGLDVPAYLKLYQDIRELLIKAGAKTGKELPSENALVPASTLLARTLGEPFAIGIKDFLAFVCDTKPDFALVAVKAPIEEVATHFSQLHEMNDWKRDVPLRPAAESEDVDVSHIALVQLKAKPWTVLYRSVLHLGEQDSSVAVADAKALSTKLKTRAIAFVGETTADAMRYDLYDQGARIEMAEWTVGTRPMLFTSTLRKKPRGAVTGEDIADELFQSEGIYLPACYCASKGNTSCLAIESPSANTITRVDLITP